MTIPTRFFPNENIIDPPGNLQSSYRRIILISHRSHIGLINANDPDFLVVSTDWLTWIECQKQGMDALHLDWAIQDWPASKEGEAADVFINHCNWMYRKGSDISLFEGVSLGKLLNREIGLMARGWIRMWHGLDQICSTYQPQEIIFIDLREFNDALDNNSKQEIVRSISEHHNIKVIDQFTPRPQNDPGYPEAKGFQDSVPLKSRNDLLRNVYSTFIYWIFRVRLLFLKKKPTYFFQLNPATIKNLIDTYSPEDAIRPVILASEMPKTLKFLLICWKKGILLTQLPASGLEEQDLAKLSHVKEECLKFLDDAPSGLETAKLNYVIQLLDREENGLHRIRNIKRYTELFRRHHFSGIVVGDTENSLCRMLAEISANDNVVVNELLNGIFVSPTRFDARCGDGIRAPLVNNILAWGHNEEKWLHESNANLPFTRCGYPGIDHLKFKNSERDFGLGNALVLPFGPDRADVKGLRANIFSYLVNIIAMLTRIGFKKVRVKLHPGLTNQKYYEDVLKAFNLDADVYQQGGLMEHVDWADVVIGPVNSGAMIETMATGKPYFPMLGKPTSLSKNQTEIANGSNTVKNLEVKILNKDFADNKKTLDYYCSFADIPNASRKVWETLGNESTN